MREDRYTNTEHDAGLYESRRGQADDPDDRPTRLEAERDEAAWDDSCRAVEVDGEVIRVHGGQEMDADDRAALTDIVRAAKRRFADECRHLHQTDVAADDALAEPVWVCDTCGKVCEP